MELVNAIANNKSIRIPRALERACIDSILSKSLTLRELGCQTLDICVAAVFVNVSAIDDVHGDLKKPVLDQIDGLMHVCTK